MVYINTIYLIYLLHVGWVYNNIQNYEVSKNVWSDSKDTNSPLRAIDFGISILCKLDDWVLLIDTNKWHILPIMAGLSFSTVGQLGCSQACEQALLGRRSSSGQK